MPRKSSSVCIAGKLDQRYINKVTKYQHYKGGIYTLLHIATHSETLEKLVVYDNAEGRVWVRPYDMFFENVEVDGVMVPRFKEIRERKDLMSKQTENCMKSEIVRRWCEAYQCVCNLACDKQSIAKHCEYEVAEPREDDAE